MSHRNLDHLHRRKIIYRSFPTTDKPSKVFQWGYFYEEGTYECYDLFRSKAKITLLAITGFVAPPTPVFGHVGF